MNDRKRLSILLLLVGVLMECVFVMWKGASS